MTPPGGHELAGRIGNVIGELGTLAAAARSANEHEIEHVLEIVHKGLRDSRSIGAYLSLYIVPAPTP